MTFAGRIANLMQILGTLLTKTATRFHYKACPVCHGVQTDQLRKVMTVLALVAGSGFSSK